MESGSVVAMVCETVATAPQDRQQDTAHHFPGKNGDSDECVKRPTSECEV